jgi:glutamate racemase
MSASPLAVFDSGLGGLSVVQHLRQLLPHEDVVYFGVPFASDPERQAQILRAYGLKERVDYSWVYR